MNDENSALAPPDRDACETSGGGVYRFDIFRYPGGEDASCFRTYEVEVDRNMSVLEALLKIQEEQDPTLAFRYCCRGAVCGSCAMSVNGSPQLACRAQLKDLRGKPVVVEPLPGFEVLKDLVVNMDGFWEQYRNVEPWLHDARDAARESLISEDEQAQVDSLVNCILCGVCYAACPVSRRKPEFTGPAALAKLDRFLSDSREHRSQDTLREQDSPDGLWACHTVMACSRACPKDVRPADSIRSLRRRWFIERVKRTFRRSGGK